MQNSATSIQNHKALASYSLPTSKSLGGTQPQGAAQGANVAGCAQWIEQNTNLYQAVMNGSSGLSQQDQQTFIEWYRYAYQTAFGGAGSNWGGGIHEQGAPTMTELPAGSKMGPNGDIVFNAAEGEFTYSDGVANPIQVFSDAFALNVSVKAKVHIEKTTDTKLKPAQEVYKVTINDPSSSPAESVLFLSTDTKLELNTINGKGVTFAGGIEADKMADGTPRFTVGNFTAQTNADGSVSAGAESSLEGKDDLTRPGTKVYKPDFEGETIDFKSVGGKSEVHEVFANANILCKPGDTATARLDAGTGDLTVTVTHDDKSTDTYVIKKGYNAVVQINKEYITFATDKGPAKLEDLAGRLKVPSLAADGAGAAGAGKVDTGKGPEANAKVEAFMAVFTDPKITFEDVKNAGLVDEIAYGNTKPSAAMLNFIFKHDNACKSYQGKMDLLAKRFATILNTLGYKAEGAKQIDKENDIFGQNVNNLTVNGTTWNIWPRNLNDWSQGFEELRPIALKTE